MQRYIKRGDQGQKNFTWFPVVVHWCTSTTSAAVRLGSFCSPQWWSRAWCVCKSCYSVVEPMCLWGVKLFRRLPFTCLTWSLHGYHAPPPSSSASAPRRSQAAGGSSKKEEGWWLLLIRLFPQHVVASASQRLSTRVGHAYAEYAVHADYAHMRNMRMRMKNLIHIIHI